MTEAQWQAFREWAEFTACSHVNSDDAPTRAVLRGALKGAVQALSRVFPEDERRIWDLFDSLVR